MIDTAVIPKTRTEQIIQKRMNIAETSQNMTVATLM